MKRNAFTLLEVLVASGIFCFAVLGLLFGMHVAVDAAHSVQVQKAVRSRMESRLARLSVPPLREYHGKSEQDGVAYSEEIVREEVRAEGVPDVRGYWRVRVEARWKENGLEQNWEASHLAWSPR